MSAVIRFDTGRGVRIPAKALEHAKAVRIDSTIEAMFAQQAKAVKLPPWERNYRFLPDRKLEIDFAWVDIKFGIEIDGAVHRITTRFHADREKHAQALLAGWTILPVTGRHVRGGEAIQWAEELLKRRMP